MKTQKNPKIEILAVGTELLTPFFQDTNSLYLTQRLNELGLDVSFKTIVGDERDDLLLCIKDACSRANLIIATGGLGPTQDDRTREVFAEVLNRKLIYKKEITQKIEKRFKHRGMHVPPVNEKQSFIIEGAEILENKNGTAPGLWIDTGSEIIILLPGPPHELKPMFESAVFPRLEKTQSKYTKRITIKITGLTESKIESLISDLYPEEPDCKLGILAYPGQIEIHLTGHSKESTSQAKEKTDRLAKSLLERLGNNVFSTSGEELEEIIGKLLTARKETLAVAESCTGGLLGHRITNVPGSSNYFLQGVQVYSNKAKNQILGVPSDLIEKYGAVSSEVAQCMASSIRENAQASYGLSITGIAGPSGGTTEKPVGLVYTALSWENGMESKKNLFLGNRKIIKFQSSQKALDMLRRHLLKNIIQG